MNKNNKNTTSTKEILILNNIMTMNHTMIPKRKSNP